MIGIRTPLKARPTEGNKSPKSTTSPPTVRRSVGEMAERLEAAGPSSENKTPPLATKTVQAGPAKTTLKPPSRLIQEHSPPKPRYADRSAEAKACLTRAKMLLGTSKNIKTEIKTGITEVLDRLFLLVKEAEKSAKTRGEGNEEQIRLGKTDANLTYTSPEDSAQDHKKLEAQIRSHSVLLENHTKSMEELKAAIEQHKGQLESDAIRTYAGVTANQSGRANSMRSTLHSIVVTSKDETETGDEVLDKVRKVADAKEGWVRVEKVRKAKDRKIIMGFQTIEERDKLKGKLVRDSQDLHVEEVKNKDPMLILRGVLSANSDEDILKALRNQNRDVFRNLDKEEDRAVVKFRRRTRNPHTCHVVVSVSPAIWGRAVELGRLHIDLQQVKVEDQTPLVQCTRCLGYGHGKKFCKESVDLCSHCGGPHMRAECPEWLSSSPPTCRNCTKAKMDHDAQHNAFSLDCPVRKRWDEIARSTVAYC